MHGQDVFKFASNASIKDINKMLSASGYDASDVDIYLLHQANLRIINNVRDHLKQSEEKFPVVIQKYGNTSSASLAILLDELNLSGRLKRGNKLIMSAFGAGFVSGACAIEW